MIFAKAFATKLNHFVRNDEAATAAEYGILAALVAVAIIGAVTTFGTSLQGMFSNLSTQVAKH